MTRTKPPIREIVTKEALGTLLEEGLTTREIAERLKVDPDTVRRGRVRHGFREKCEHPSGPPYSKAEMERIRLLAAEGMPATWIAEDIGRPVEAVRRRAAKSLDPEVAAAHRADWANAWGSIRPRAHLRALHEEFAPKKVMDKWWKRRSKPSGSISPGGKSAP